MTSTIGGFTGAATGVLGAPAGINPISNPALAFGARLAVNGISGGVEYGLSEVMDGKSPTVNGLIVSVGIGLTAGLAGEAFPGYQSQTLKTFGNTPYTKSPVTAFNEFSESLRSFLPKELAFQGVDDVIRSGGISIPVELFDAHYFDRMRK